jgi:hypothetical protein
MKIVLKMKNLPQKLLLLSQFLRKKKVLEIQMTALRMKIPRRK